MPPACTATVCLATLPCPLNPKTNVPKCQRYRYVNTDVSEGDINCPKPSLKVHCETDLSSASARNPFASAPSPCLSAGDVLLLNQLFPSHSAHAILVFPRTALTPSLGRNEVRKM